MRAGFLAGAFADARTFHLGGIADVVVHQLAVHRHSTDIVSRLVEFYRALTGHVELAGAGVFPVDRSGGFIERGALAILLGRDFLRIGKLVRKGVEFFLGQTVLAGMRKVALTVAGRDYCDFPQSWLGLDRCCPKRRCEGTQYQRGECDAATLSQLKSPRPWVANRALAGEHVT